MQYVFPNGIWVEVGEPGAIDHVWILKPAGPSPAPLAVPGSDFTHWQDRGGLNGNTPMRSPGGFCGRAIAASSETDWAVDDGGETREGW